MCGRFTLRNLDNLETKYGSTDFEASYNIGPGQKLLKSLKKFLLNITSFLAISRL